MNGFKDFVLKGNVLDLAVAVVIATAFGKVVEAMVTVIMEIIGKIGDTPDFSKWTPTGLSVGALLTLLISFLILAAVIYLLRREALHCGQGSLLPGRARRRDGRPQHRAPQGDPRQPPRAAQPLTRRHRVS